MSERRKSLGLVVLTGWISVFVPHPSAAQEEASFADFHFNRSLPGARSLAMAGAFVAIADDATAAYANPAGLTTLTRREVALEGRRWTNAFDYTERGRINGAPSGIGIDTEPGLVSRRGTSKTQALSFASYVEADPHRRWVASAFYRAYARYESDFRSQGVFSGEDGRRFGPYRFTSDFAVDSVGASYARQFGNCFDFVRCIRAGVTLASFSLEMDGLQVVFADPPNNEPITTREPRVLSAERSGNDRDTAYSAGLLWEPARAWAVGVAYRQGPEFSIGQRVSNRFTRARLSLPHEYSLGARWRSALGFLVGVEATRVLYSRLLVGNSLQGLKLDDATELRIGFNKSLRETDLGDKWIVMAGLWYDPDHGLKAPERSDRVRRAYFRGGRSQLHGSAGVGRHYRGLTANVAIDVSRDTHAESLSLVFRR